MKKNRSAGVATSLPLEAELDLVQWVNDLRNEGMPVTSIMLQLQALEVAKEYGVTKFEASSAWQSLFRKRHRLAMRCRTRQGQVTPADAKQIATDFAVKVRSKMAELGVSKVYNADQTAVFYEYLPKKTLNKRGEKTVWVRGGNKEKQRLTAMMLADSSGTKYPPMLVYKCKPSQVPETALANTRDRHGFSVGMWKGMEPVQARTEMPIYCNAKGWFESELAMEFLRHYFAGRANPDEPILLLWDDFSGHWTAEVVAYANTINVFLEKVPPNCTAVCQPADIAWMKPLKDRPRRKWIRSIRDQLRNRIPGHVFKMKAPDRAEMAQWIHEVWNDMAATIICNGFRKAGFIDKSSIAEEVRPPPLLEDDEDVDVLALLKEAGRLDVEVGIIDPDYDFDP